MGKEVERAAMVVEATEEVRVAAVMEAVERAAAVTGKAVRG